MLYSIKVFVFCKISIRVYTIRKYIRDCYNVEAFVLAFRLGRSAKVGPIDVSNVDTLILAHVIRNRDTENPIEHKKEGHQMLLPLLNTRRG